MARKLAAAVEERLKGETSLRRISEVPWMRLSDMTDLRELSADGTITLGISKPAAREMASWLLDELSLAKISILVWVSLLYWAVMLGLAAWYRSVVPLVGVPIAAGTLYYGNPLNPRNAFWGFMAYLGAVATVGSILTGQAMLAWVLSAAVVPLVASRSVYRIAVDETRILALQHEAVFLYLLENGHCTIRDNRDGKVFHIGGSWQT